VKESKEYIESAEFHQKLQRRNKDAFRALYEFYKIPVYSVVFSMIKDNERTADILQDTFIQAIKKIHQLQDFKKMKYWIFRIAINLTINQLNKEKKCYLLGDDLDLITDKTAVADFQVKGVEDFGEMRDLILELLDRLPIKQRVVFNLKYVEGFKESEIADIVDIPVGTVKSRLNIARTHLKIWLEKEIGE
jgi:RNA polymerase sigma-70 factor, ECF subfamily